MAWIHWSDREFFVMGKGWAETQRQEIKDSKQVQRLRADLSVALTPDSRPVLSGASLFSSSSHLHIPPSTGMTSAPPVSARLLTCSILWHSLTQPCHLTKQTYWKKFQLYWKFLFSPCLGFVLPAPMPLQHYFVIPLTYSGVHLFLCAFSVEFFPLIFLFKNFFK